MPSAGAPKVVSALDLLDGQRSTNETIESLAKCVDAVSTKLAEAISRSDEAVAKVCTQHELSLTSIGKRIDDVVTSIRDCEGVMCSSISELRTKDEQCAENIGEVASEVDKIHGVAECIASATERQVAARLDQHCAEMRRLALDDISVTSASLQEMQSAWTASEQAILARFAQLSESVEAWQGRLADQLQGNSQRTTELSIENDALQAALEEVRRQLEPAHGVSTGSCRLPDFPQQAPEAPLENIPGAWRAMVEDNVRRSAKAACDELRREVFKRMSDDACSFRTATEASERQRLLDLDVVKEQVKAQVADVRNHADDARNAARKAFETAAQVESACLRQTSRIEADIREELQAIPKRGEFIEMCNSRANELVKRCSGTESKCITLGNELHNVGVQLQRLETSASQWAMTVKELVSSELVGVRAGIAEQVQRAIPSDSVKKEVSDIAKGLSEVRCFVESSSQGLKSEIRALKDRLAKESAHMCAKAEWAASIATNGFTAEGGEAVEIDGFLSSVRRTALTEAQVTLDAKCEELRHFNDSLRHAAVEEARQLVQAKCGEMRVFADRVKNAAVDELRAALRAPETFARSKCGAGGGIDAVRTLKVHDSELRF